MKDDEVGELFDIPESTVRILKHSMGLPLRPTQISKKEIEKYGLQGKLSDRPIERPKMDLDKYMKSRRSKIGKRRKRNKERGIQQSDLDRALQGEVPFARIP